MTPPDIVRIHPLIEEILDGQADAANGDEDGFRGYRGHAYRVFNFARALAADEDDRDDKLAIAAAFHDLAAFAGLDYLAPSIRRQDAWLERTGRGAWSDELAVIVAEHHHARTYRGRYAALAEPFRRADLVDLSQGLVRAGIPRDHVRAVRGAFDVGTFFTRAVPRAAVRNLLRRPFDPVPHMRARRALEQSGHPGADS